MKELESLKVYLDLKISSESLEYLGNVIGKQNGLRFLNLQIGYENTELNMKNSLYFFKEINKISFLEYFDFNIFQYKQELGEHIDDDDDDENSNQNTDTSQLLQTSNDIEEMKKDKQQALSFTQSLANLVKQKLIVNKKVKNMIYKQNQSQIYRKEIISESSLISCLEKL